MTCAPLLKVAREDATQRNHLRSGLLDSLAPIAQTHRHSATQVKQEHPNVSQTAKYVIALDEDGALDVDGDAILNQRSLPLPFCFSLPLCFPLPLPPSPSLSLERLPRGSVAARGYRGLSQETGVWPGFVWLVFWGFAGWALLAE